MSDIEQSGWARIGVAGALAREYAQDAALFLESLARLLESAVPEQTEPLRAGGFLRKKEITGVVVQLGDSRYRIERHGSALMASRTHVVRGIALKTEEIPVDEWIAEVGEGVQQIAETNSQAREALRAMLG